MIGTILTICIALAGVSMDLKMVNGMKNFSGSITGLIHELLWGTTNTDGTVWLGVNGVKAESLVLMNDLTNDLPAKI